MGWRVKFLLYLRRGHGNIVSFNGTNQAQTNDTGLEGFGRHGVESDVTALFFICYF